MTKKYIECDCDSFEHLVRFWYDEDQKDFLYIDVQLNHYMNFLWRLKTAFCFIFKIKTGYWMHYDCTMLPKEKVKELEKLTVDFITDKKLFT